MCYWQKGQFWGQTFKEKYIWDRDWKLVLSRTWSKKEELTVHLIETNGQIANVMTMYGASAQNCLHCFDAGLVNTVFMK